VEAQPTKWLRHGFVANFSNGQETVIEGHRNLFPLDPDTVEKVGFMQAQAEFVETEFAFDAAPEFGSAFARFLKSHSDMFDQI
jgi:hypothetical protein